MRLRSPSVVITAAISAITVLAVWACTQNPSIDGSTVAKIGSSANPPTCTELCPRIAKICGLLPQQCTLGDGGGYCDQYFDDQHRVCAGQAGTCLELESCSNVVVDTDAATDAGEDAGEGDADAEDAKTDAPADAKAD
ncbi:hypothetical protein BH09MYX1_BH09MYX1_32350 [soil metagenome]